ncbi:MAG TPA: ABC transporter permease [Acidisarcina sp.]
MTALLQDIRYALRQLRNSPGFTITAVLTLALGIGANTAIFTVLDQVLLRNLPVPHPDQLVMLRFTGLDDGSLHTHGGDNNDYFSFPMYRDLRDKGGVFTGLLATDSTDVGVGWHNETSFAPGELVSGNYFDVLGIKPAIGRLFVAADDVQPDANPVVVLSFAYWQQRFGADPSIVNQQVSINGHPFTVLGVTPPAFHSVVMGTSPAVFAPMTMKALIKPGTNDLLDRRSKWLNIIGRLRPGLGAMQAQAQIDTVWHGIRAEELKDFHHVSPRFREGFLDRSHLLLLDGGHGFSPLRDQVKIPLLIVMGMVLLVGLMACANVSSLLLVRAAGRVREMSIRYALGAGRAQVLRQLITEGLLLGLTGGALGVLLSPPIASFLFRHMEDSPGSTPFSSHADLRILVFNFGTAILVSLLFSLAPAFQFWRPDVVPALKDQASTLASGSLRLRRLTVGVQIGLSILLMVGAGLFVRTILKLKNVDVGFSTDHLVACSVRATLAGYDLKQTPELYRSIVARLSALPGVRSVAATSDAELANNNTGYNITVAGYQAREGEDTDVESEQVSPDYFKTMRMTLLAGRDIADSDGPATGKVAVVNEMMARRYFGDPARAVGRFYGNGGGNVPVDIQIVGVVRDAKHTGLREGILPTVFRPYTQQTPPGSMVFYVRTWQSPEDALNGIRQAIRRLDSRIVVDSLRTMDDQVDEALQTERMVALLAISFSALATLLAAIGLYGVLAYSTAQRTREIGIRVALGASRLSVISMVLSEVTWLAGISIAIALPLAMALTHFLKAQLFGVSTNDPLTMFVATTLAALVAMTAALLPAARAAKADPMTALRYE